MTLVVTNIIFFETLYQNINNLPKNVGPTCQVIIYFPFPFSFLFDVFLLAGRGGACASCRHHWSGAGLGHRHIGTAMVVALATAVSRAHRLAALSSSCPVPTPAHPPLCPSLTPATAAWSRASSDDRD